MTQTWSPGVWWKATTFPAGNDLPQQWQGTHSQPLGVSPVRALAPFACGYCAGPYACARRPASYRAVLPSVPAGRTAGAWPGGLPLGPVTEAESPVDIDGARRAIAQREPPGASVGRYIATGSAKAPGKALPLAERIRPAAS